MVRLIPLTRGGKALVDDEDYGWLTNTKWADDSRGYAIRKVKGRNSTEKMHRLITEARPGEVVDHINGRPWDNRRCNLRIVPQRENAMNTRKHSDNKTGYKGVAINSKPGKTFTAQITVNYRKLHLGCFDDVIEAAIAYNNAARQHFGDMAVLNEIPAEFAALGARGNIDNISEVA